MTILRWILVFPIAILAAAIVSIPVHLVVMFTLGGWGIDPVIEIQNPETLAGIERFLQGIFGPLTAIYFAALTAPKGKTIVALALGGVVVFGLPIIVFLWNRNTMASGSGIVLEYGILRILASAAGVVAAVVLVYLKGQESSKALENSVNGFSD